MKANSKRLIAMFIVLALCLTIFGACGQKTEPLEPGQTVAPIKTEELGEGTVKWTETETEDGFMLVTNEGGATLSYSKDSGVTLLQSDGFAFKDLNKNGELDGYEDWRLDAETRAQDLASRLSVEEMAGLMIHPSAFAIDEELESMKSLLDAEARTVLSFATSSPVETQAKWVNAMQAYTEAIGHGIPVEVSTNPRTSPVWPDNLALAATFDPEFVLEVSQNLAKEYRSIGVGILLGPQIDLASEPRWVRFSGTFGEDPALARDLTNASVKGHQSTYDESGTDIGWGEDSVIAMIKHWPSDGAGQAGRESHDFYGKYTVYPGDQFETALIPFVDGGFNSDGATGSAGAIMDSYSIAWSDDGSLGKLEASAFSEYKNSLSRSYGFDGVICSDWAVVNAERAGMLPFDTGWGKTVEKMETNAERVYAAIVAGTNQIGGENNVQSVIDAFQIGVGEIGEEAMMEYYQVSSAKILKNMFVRGLFENPYRDVAKAVSLVGGEEAMAKGYEAQAKTAIMLKNADNTIKAEESSEKPTVYVPMVYTPGSQSLRGVVPASIALPVEMETLEQYFNVVTDTVSETLTGPADEEGNATPVYNDIIKATPEQLAECDYALVFADAPENMGGGVTSKGYDLANGKYIPISLQYGPYTADSSSVRTESIASPTVEKEIAGTYGVEIVEEQENVAYCGESAIVTNSFYLDMILYASDNMPEEGKVIVAINASKPMIMSEFESKVDAIVMGFGIDKKVYLDIATGKIEPSGLLPMQLPANMETVEAQYEDVPRDVECYVDSEGNTYDFAYGMNWSGVISDERTEEYDVPALVSPENQPNS